MKLQDYFIQSHKNNKIKNKNKIAIQQENGTNITYSQLNNISLSISDFIVSSQQLVCI